MLITTQTGKWALTILSVCLFASYISAAPPSGAGGGSKVSVTAANPPDAFQGEELDVVVSGSGFDAGSTVSYFVTGTTDASQVDVISVQYISSTELKTRVRPKDNALPSEYDIEVRASSGRKGKGTTLFRVKTSTPIDPALAVGITSTNSKKGSKNGNLFIFEADGIRNEMIVERASGLFYNTLPLVWTRDGSKIIWVDGETKSIKWSSPDGSSFEDLLPFNGVLSPHYGGIRSIGTSAIDCNGVPASLLYFQAVTEGDDLWRTNFHVMDLENSPGIAVPLTENGDASYQSIAISPDGVRAVTWTSYAPNFSPSSATSRLEVRDLCSPGLSVQQSWSAADLRLPEGAQVFESSWSSTDLLAVTVYFPKTFENGEGRDWTHEIFLVDLALDPNAVIATKIIGDGTGLGEGVQNTRARWSPDGEELAFVSDFESMNSLRIQTGESRHLFNSGTVIRDIDWRPTWGNRQ